LVEPDRQINETNQIDRRNQMNQKDRAALFRPQASKSSFLLIVY
jgi:hypothetical protein